ncbi:MAG TPA: peptidoglycan-associated lipoprotein Pal [Rhizomicrobium sp.]|jgi:peptidoglycan-associated lipoprotein|nr:peptidoglycan-associated lipoprotein Pal [Rhizomicrobium sp.]
MLKIPNHLRIAAFAAAIVIAGCAHKPPPAAEAPPSAPPPAPQAQNQVESTVVPGSMQDFRVNVGDTVHFAYDKYEVMDQDRDILQRQAAWLQRYPQVRVTVEGHCDPRGTREYNLALGARRANAVKDYLISLGVPASRVDTISYGKERPVCTESDESCWAQDRRGVTTITSGAVTS